MYLSPDYSPDVVISYSHGDVDHSGQSELKAWSQRFARAFEAELRQEFKNASVFFDESPRAGSAVDPTLPLTAQLRDTLQGAALLVVLMSPQYLASAWCRDERDWWIQQHGRRGDVRGRMFVARIWPTEERDWPAELRDERGHALVGFWFHSREDDGAAIRPFGWLGRTDDRNEFTEQLLRLVGAAARRMRDMKRDLEARHRVVEEARRLAADGGQALYLHARQAHEAAWSEAYQALDGLGYVVVPAAPEPPAATPERVREIGEERVSQLAACDALLLLGTDDGYALDGDMLSVGRQSRHLARARSGKLLPCAVLAAGGPAIATEARRALARKLAIGWIEEPPKVRDWLAGSTARLEGMP